MDTLEEWISKIDAKVNAASEGPWETLGGVVWRKDVETVADPRDESGMTPIQQQVQVKVADSSPEDAAFIAEVRTIVPALLSVVKSVQNIRHRASLAKGNSERAWALRDIADDLGFAIIEALGVSRG